MDKETEVRKMLEAGATYAEIKKQLQVSPKTIAKVKALYNIGGGINKEIATMRKRESNLLNRSGSSSLTGGSASPTTENSSQKEVYHPELTTCYGCGQPFQWRDPAFVSKEVIYLLDFCSVRCYSDYCEEVRSGKSLSNPPEWRKKLKRRV